jgi:hypothetical protein
MILQTIFRLSDLIIPQLLSDMPDGCFLKVWALAIYKDKSFINLHLIVYFIQEFPLQCKKCHVVAIVVTVTIPQIVKADTDCSQPLTQQDRY